MGLIALNNTQLYPVQSWYELPAEFNEQNAFLSEGGSRRKLQIWLVLQLENIFKEVDEIVGEPSYIN